MKRSIYVLVLASILTTGMSLIFSSCATSTKSTSMNMNGSIWTIESLMGKTITTPADAKAISMTFNEDGTRVSGYAGCNNYNAGILKENGKMKFSPAAMTRMMCPDMAQESAFTKVLNTTTDMKVVDGKLKVMNGDEVLAVFKKVN
jgi:heat shock protein HslJ